MAFALLDGATAAVDIATDVDDSDGGEISHKCKFRIATVSYTQGTLGYVTYCSAGYVENRPTIKQITFSLLGYASKGDAKSQPGSFMSVTTPATVVITIDTGCKIRLYPVFTLDTVGVTAFGETTRIVEGVSNGAPKSEAWVTS